MKRMLLIISAAALAVVMAGCATTPTQRTEKLLTQSGFKPVKASTPAQQERLNSLPPSQLSLVKRKGQTYYVFPDHARNLLYVGKKPQYQAYQIAAQDQYLAGDAKLMRDASASPMLTQDSLQIGGSGPSWEEIWEGWPEE